MAGAVVIGVHMCEQCGMPAGTLASFAIEREGDPLYLCAVCAVELGHVIPLFGVKSIGVPLESIAEVFRREREREERDKRLRAKLAEIPSAVSRMSEDELREAMACEPAPGAYPRAPEWALPLGMSKASSRLDQYMEEARKRLYEASAVLPPGAADRALTMRMGEDRPRCGVCDRFGHTTETCPTFRR